MVHHPPSSILPLVILLGLAGTTRAQAQSRSSTTRFEVGQPFPAVALPALEDGRTASLADFRGKKLLLHVFASW
jgi:hypothetical protein